MTAAMTTFARGMSAPKRAVDAFTRIERSVIDRMAVANPHPEIRSAISADAAERRAIRREQAWIEAAAMAGIRPIPRG